MRNQLPEVLLEVLIVHLLVLAERIPELELLLVDEPQAGLVPILLHDGRQVRHYRSILVLVLYQLVEHTLLLLVLADRAYVEQQYIVADGGLHELRGQRLKSGVVQLNN